MNFLRVLRATYIWLREWSRFSRHYMETWECIDHAPSYQEFLEIRQRMATGPMRYEYARILKLREDSRQLWYKALGCHDAAWCSWYCPKVPT